MASKTEIEVGREVLPDICTMADVCDLLEVTEQTVRRWIKNDGMPGFKRGHFWFFDLGAVVTWQVARGPHPTRKAV